MHSKHVVQNKKNGHKKLNNSPNYHGEIKLYLWIGKGAHNDTQHQHNAHLKNTPIDCDGVQLTNVTWYLYPYSDKEIP